MKQQKNHQTVKLNNKRGIITEDPQVNKKTAQCPRGTPQNVKGFDLPEKQI